MVEECDTCRFYRKDNMQGWRQGAGQEVATCCRFPPVYAVGNDFGGDDVYSPGVWWQPSVLSSYWCGEYKKYEQT